MLEPSKLCQSASDALTFFFSSQINSEGFTGKLSRALYVLVKGGTCILDASIPAAIVYLNSFLVTDSRQD